MLQFFFIKYFNVSTGELFQKFNKRCDRLGAVWQRSILTKAWTCLFDATLRPPLGTANLRPFLRIKRSEHEARPFQPTARLKCVESRPNSLFAITGLCKVVLRLLFQVFLTVALHWFEWSALCSDRLTPGKVM
jgi:hypothetical protein